MDDSPERWPFADAAPYYDACRPPYAPEALEHVVRRFGVGPGVRVLDLGCGPGTLAIPLSRLGAAVTAVDPDAQMLAQARRLAAERGAGAVTWICARAEEALDDLATAPDARPFHLVTFGQSLHWMDRDRVLAAIGDVLDPRIGGLAIIDEPPDIAPESWAAAARAVVGRYLGRPPRHPMKHPEVAHEPCLDRSARFRAYDMQRFGTTFTRTPASILGHIYSGVHTTRPAFGDRAPAFEAELLAELERLRPSGLFEERAETVVITSGPRRSGAT